MSLDWFWKYEENIDGMYIYRHMLTELIIQMFKF